MNSNRNILIINGWWLFVIICFLSLIILFILNSYIFTNQFYYRTFSDQLTTQGLEIFLGLKDRYSWVGYLSTPIILLFKTSLVSVCLSIGTILFSLDFKFKSIFKSVLLAEGVFIIAQIIYLINLSQHLNTLTIESSLNYFPLTVLSIYGAENVVPWLHYPLQTLNLFEVAYILCISWLLSKQWKLDFIESINIVLPSYGIGLLIWIVLVIFLTLQIS